MTRTTLLLNDICAAIGPTLRANLDEPMEFAIVAWPKADPAKATVVGTPPSQRELSAVFAGVVDVLQKAAAARGEKDN